MYKFKYLVFKEKPYNYGVTVAQIDVTHLTRKQIKTEWDRLVKNDFPEDQFASSLTETQKEIRVFNNRIQPTEKVSKQGLEKGVCMDQCICAVADEFPGKRIKCECDGNLL